MVHNTLKQEGIVGYCHVRGSTTMSCDLKVNCVLGM